MSGGTGIGAENNREHMVAKLRKQFEISGPLKFFVRYRRGDDSYETVCIAIVACIEWPGAIKREREIIWLSCSEDANSGLDARSNPTEGFPDFMVEKKFRSILKKFLQENLGEFEKISFLLRRGVEKYIRMIEIYSETRAVYDQLRHAIGKLNLDNPIILEKLCKALHAIGEVPACDVELKMS